MKKLLVLALAIMMLLSVVSCSSSSNGSYGNDYSQDSISNNSDQSHISDGSKNKIDMSKVTDSSGFSEGKAWVRFGEITSEEYSTVHCINKNGEILFSIKQNILNAPSDFYNGIALIPMSVEGKSVCNICDENGNITKPSDVGADEFLIDIFFGNDKSFELFKNGYILAKKVTTTFNSSSEKMAILDSDLHVLADFSEEVYNLYEEFEYSTYYDGYLISKEKGQILDLRTGKTVDNPTTVLESFNPQYASDLWSHKSNYRDHYYYETFSASDTKTIDLSQYSDTIYRMYDFQGGVAPIVFRSANKYFFTVIQEDGSFLYEPIELSGVFNELFSCQGKYVVLSENCLETFDKTGKLAELSLNEFESSGQFTVANHFRINFSDGVINLRCENALNGNHFYYYTADFKPLF